MVAVCCDCWYYVANHRQMRPMWTQLQLCCGDGQLKNFDVAGPNHVSDHLLKTLVQECGLGNGTCRFLDCADRLPKRCLINFWPIDKLRVCELWCFCSWLCVFVEIFWSSPLRLWWCAIFFILQVRVNWQCWIFGWFLLKIGKE